MINPNLNLNPFRQLFHALLSTVAPGNCSLRCSTSPHPCGSQAPFYLLHPWSRTFLHPCRSPASGHREGLETIYAS